MSAEAAIAVDCKAVTKSYGSGDSRVLALRGADLEVCSGELMMLVGPSGSGKTTLISILAGILDRDGGECRIFGQDFRRMGRSEKARFRSTRIGFVFQSFNLVPTLSAAENTAIPLLINGMPRREAIARASEILASVGLGERTKALPSELSGGQQQRVAISRALVHEPSLIVCDEPTSALDHETGRSVMELLRRMALKGDRVLIIVTHDARIFEFADRIATMDDGRIYKVSDSLGAPIPPGVCNVAGLQRAPAGLDDS